MIGGTIGFYRYFCSTSSMILTIPFGIRPSPALALLSVGSKRSGLAAFLCAMPLTRSCGFAALSLGVTKIAQLESFGVGTVVFNHPFLRVLYVYLACSVQPGLTWDTFDLVVENYAVSRAVYMLIADVFLYTLLGRAILHCFMIFYQCFTDIHGILRILLPRPLRTFSFSFSDSSSALSRNLPDLCPAEQVRRPQALLLHPHPVLLARLLRLQTAP